MKYTIICTVIIATSLNASAGFFDKVTKALDSDSDKKQTEAPKKTLTIKQPKRSYSYEDSNMNQTKRMLSAFEPFYRQSLQSEATESYPRMINVGSSAIVNIPEDETVLKVLDDGSEILTDKYVYRYSGAGLNIFQHTYESVLAVCLGGRQDNKAETELNTSIQTALKNFEPKWEEILNKKRSGIVAFKPRDIQWGDSIEVLTFNGISTANGFQRDADREYYFGINFNTKGYGDPKAGVYRLMFKFGLNEIDETEAVKKYTTKFGEPKLEETHQFRTYTWDKDGIKTVGKFTKHGTFMTEINQYSNKHFALHEEFVAQGKTQVNEARKNSTGSALGF